MFKKSTFVRRFGEPASFVFHGQIFDTHNADSTPGDTPCGVCGRRTIRFLATLHRLGAPDRNKLRIGRCCFHYFRRWNSPLYDQLKIAVKYEINRHHAIEQSKKQHGGLAELQAHSRTWRSLQREAVALLNNLRTTNASAPVGTFMELLQAVKRKPATHERIGTAVLWYHHQIERLRQKMGQLFV